MTVPGFVGMRIGLIGPLPPPSGGMANQTRQLGELLTAEGALVSMVQVNAPYWPSWIQTAPGLRSLFRLVPYLVKLWRVAGVTDVFHVMANSGWSWHLFAAPAIWIARMRRVAVIVNYRGGEAEQFLVRAGNLVHFTMRRAQALIVPSGFLQTVFARFQMQASIVPNIIDLSRFQPRTASLAVAPHLLVARNLELLYDNASAVKAFQIVKTSFPLARLTIAGSGPEESSLRKLVHDLGLDGAVTFSGRLEREAMSRMYQSADLVLNPSLADNMPNSLLEAWASGVPVVSTDVGGIPFLAQDGVTASLVPAGNPVAMAHAAEQLLSDQSLWLRRAQAALAEAQRYTWTQVKPVLAETYHRAINPGHA